MQCNWDDSTSFTNSDSRAADDGDIIQVPDDEDERGKINQIV
jgi:hypothetical protein